MAAGSITLLLCALFAVAPAFPWVPTHGGYHVHHSAPSRTEYVRHFVSRPRSYVPSNWPSFDVARRVPYEDLSMRIPQVQTAMAVRPTAWRYYSAPSTARYPAQVVREASFLQPGEECKKSALPCADGHACSCGGICVKEVTAKITFAADDLGKLFICGRKITATKKRTEMKVVEYTGPCSDIYVSATNRKRQGTEIAGVAVAFEMDGVTYSSGDNLYGVSATKPIPRGWRRGILGFDYSEFTPVVVVPGMEDVPPFAEMISELGAYLVTDEEKPNAKRMAFRFVAPFCFEEVAPPPPPPPPPTPPPKPALPGERCDSTLEQPCVYGFSCACNAICIKQITAKIHMLADDIGDLFICGKKIISETRYKDVKTVDYTGPCSDLYASVRNTGGWGGVALALEIGDKDYGSGTTLAGFSIPGDFPEGWELGLPGFDYSGFSAVQNMNEVSSETWTGEPFDSLAENYGAFLVGDSTDPKSSQYAFRFPAPFCFELAPMPPTPPPKPAQPGERCDSTLQQPCVDGFSCGCNGICVKQITAKIHMLADDIGDLFICGKKIISETRYKDVTTVDYTGPCSDLYASVRNTNGWGGVALAVEIGDKDYGSGTTLAGFSIPGDFPEGWELGLPGFDYSGFSAVQNLNEFGWTGEPFDSLVENYGAFLVSDSSNPTSPQYAFRFPAPFCFD